MTNINNPNAQPTFLRRDTPRLRNEHFAKAELDSPAERKERIQDPAFRLGHIPFDGGHRGVPHEKQLEWQDFGGQLNDTNIDSFLAEVGLDGEKRAAYDAAFEGVHAMIDVDINSPKWARESLTSFILDRPLQTFDKKTSMGLSVAIVNDEPAFLRMQAQKHDEAGAVDAKMPMSRGSHPIDRAELILDRKTGETIFEE